MADRKPSDILKDAITKLEALSADVDIDEATAAEANKQITALRTKVQDAAFDSIVSRTANMQTLIQALGAVIAAADHADLGDKVAGLRSLVDEARVMLGK